ncbi:DUF2529 family protein [Alkalihalobacillus sp. BA299]|uniref:DUF2529 family protein n=1 Tax=Alkalihalobacillus sp. BA299 TaxID=2815938 RepID=UPI001ADCBDFD|nr:DUF2529 family protein [Alkalihalobacillus sp. BA299]
MMLQIFTTQLSGKLKLVKEKHEELFEDCSRMLAQSIVSGHSIYLFATGEMESVIPQAIYGNDRFENIKVIESTCEIPLLEDQDTVLIFSPTNHDKAALQLARLVFEQNKDFITIIGRVDKGKDKDEVDSGLIDFTELSIELQAAPMIPKDDGTRIGTPTSLLALFVYHCLYLTTADILAEYE